jgi:hypothetical protein
LQNIFDADHGGMGGVGGGGGDWIDIPLFVFNTVALKSALTSGGPVLIMDLGENRKGRHFIF